MVGNVKEVNFNSIFMKITKDTTLAEILQLPEVEKVLNKYNLPCLSCPLAKFEMEKLKIGEVCDMYEIDIEKLIKDLNALYKRIKE